MTGLLENGIVFHFVFLHRVFEDLKYKNSTEWTFILQNIELVGGNSEPCQVSKIEYFAKIVSQNSLSSPPKLRSTLDE